MILYGGMWRNVWIDFSIFAADMNLIQICDVLKEIVFYFMNFWSFLRFVRELQEGEGAWCIWFKFVEIKQSWTISHFVSYDFWNFKEGIDNFLINFKLDLILIKILRYPKFESNRRVTVSIWQAVGPPYLDRLQRISSKGYVI